MYDAGLHRNVCLRQIRNAGGMNAVSGFGRNAKASVSGIAYGYE